MKFGIGKKSKKKFFFKRYILKSDTNNLTRIKKLFSKWILNPQHSAHLPIYLQNWTFWLSSLYHVIIPINSPSCIYGFQIRQFGWYFNIGRIFSILKLRKYLISKPVIILILNEWFLYWQIQWLELISEIVRYYHDITVIFSARFLQCIIVVPFKGVHNYQGMLL